MIDGTYIGVVDRVVDGETAVILLEADGEVIEQLHVAVDRLPGPAKRGGVVLEVEVEEGEFVDSTYLEDQTQERQQRAQDRLDRLSSRLSDREE